MKPWQVVAYSANRVVASRRFWRGSSARRFARSLDRHPTLTPFLVLVKRRRFDGEWREL